jgi:tetratricopeptide (TPR) repeat protein
MHKFPKIMMVGITSLMLVFSSMELVAQDRTDDAWKKCQSQDANKRLIGCTTIINAKGFGSRSRLADALDGRCWAYHVKGQDVLAIGDCRAAIAINPNYSYAYNNLSAAYLGIGDYANAIAAANKSIELKPQFLWSHLNRGKAYAAVGKMDEAIRDFQYALILDPSNPEANESLNKLEMPAPKQAPDTTSTPSAALPPSPVNPNSRRIALVVGNSIYKSVAQLPNPYRDAEAIAAALRRSGFQEVTLEINLGRDKFTDTLRSFARQADAADWAVVYYAGHGIEMGGMNYLIPVDARLEVDRDVEFEAIPLDRVMAAVDGAKKLRLIILDACRNNPFLGQMRRTIATRSVGRGLAPVEPEAGSLVVYSAKHGEIALDGDGTNSPFALALIRNMATPGLEVRRLFDVVRDDVIASTNARQQPFSYGSLPGSEDFFFVVK